MSDLVQILSTVLPIIAATLLLLVIFINLYLKIRRKFPINVNCWFCNSWTKVPYDDRNSFNCPTCLQYNGFTKDGDYNKIIPEQHDELLNRITPSKSQKPHVSNGLCSLCNNNQQLKVFQLAHFVPLVEENYDVEIEHFQEQLEKAYKLCKKCDRVLKKTLDKQNAWIFGNKIKNIYTGITKVAHQIKQETKMAFLAKLNGVFTTLLVLTVIFITISNIKTVTSLSRHLPTNYISTYENLRHFAKSSYKLELTVFNFTKNFKIEPYSVICGVGLTFQVLRLILSQMTPMRANQLLCWVILFLISWVRHTKSYATYILCIEAFCCIYLLSTAFWKEDAKKFVQKIQGRTMRKLVKNLEYTCTDYSDIDNMSSSSNSFSRDNSRDSSTKSIYSTQNVPQQPFTANSSFVSTKSNFDLNRSLNNLRLDNSSINGLKRPKPVLSPPKFQNVNPWVASSFWGLNDGPPLRQRTNLSRSSSESSGFGSQLNEGPHFAPSRCHFGDFDRFSTVSEFTRMSPTFGPGFYPNYQTNNSMLFVQRIPSPGLIRFNEVPRRDFFENWSDKVNAQSFSDLSLNSMQN